MDALTLWLTDYASRHGLGELQLLPGQSLALQFDDNLSVHLVCEGNDLVMYAQVGEVSVGDADTLDALLSANLLWRDTDGATLGLEPYSRAVVLAQARPLSALTDAQDVQARLDRFCQLCSSWRHTLGA